LLAAFLFFSFTATINTQTFGLLLERAAQGLDVSVATLGGLRTLENLASIVVAFAVAPIMDRYPRKVPLIAGFVLAGLAALILTLDHTVRGAVLYFIFNGAAVMLAVSIVLTAPGDLLSGRALSRMMGLMIGAFAFTPIFFLPIAGIVSDWAGWRAGFILTTCLALVAVGIALRFVPNFGQGSGSSEGYLSRYRSLLDNHELLLMLCASLARFALFNALFTFLSASLIERYDLSVSLIGLVFSAVGLMLFTGSTTSGFLLQRLGSGRALVEGGALLTVGFGLAFVADPGVVATVCLVLALVFVLGVQENAATLIVLKLGASARGAAMSWNELSAATGSMVGIGLASLGLSLAGVTGFGLVMVGLAAAGTIGIRLVLRRAGPILATPDQAPAVET